MGTLEEGGQETLTSGHQVRPNHFHCLPALLRPLPLNGTGHRSCRPGDPAQTAGPWKVPRERHWQSAELPASPSASVRDGGRWWFLRLLQDSSRFLRQRRAFSFHTARHVSSGAQGRARWRGDGTSFMIVDIVRPFSARFLIYKTEKKLFSGLSC